MKKIIIVSISILTILMLFGCGSKKDYTAQDVADSIADIAADDEGNVVVTLVNGKTFLLGNMKGDKGDKGDKGSDGYITVTRAEFDSLVRRVQALEEQD